MAGLVFDYLRENYQPAQDYYYSTWPTSFNAGQRRAVQEGLREFVGDQLGAFGQPFKKYSRIAQDYWNSSYRSPAYSDRAHYSDYIRANDSVRRYHARRNSRNSSRYYRRRKYY